MRPFSPTAVMGRAAMVSLAVLLWAVTGRAQGSQEKPAQSQPDASTPGQESQSTPVEKADDLKSKLTLAVYFTAGDRQYDINMRHQFGSVVAWVAGFFDPRGVDQGRIGAEYDYHRGWLLFIPTIEFGSSGGVAGQLYAELGNKNYGIVGYSETNLKDIADLSYDPRESVQLGAGRKINDYDKLYGFVIFDVRLHTHQQDTHIIYRHRLNAKNGITFDFLYKSGFTDEGKYIRASGAGIYYDRPKWFWKLYYDPNVNFTRHTMVRAGVGLKF